jgi:hypothetical protein
MKSNESKPRKMKAYESFSEWKKDQSPRNQRLVVSLARLIKDTAPHLTATVKWGQGCWVDDGRPKMFVHPEEDHLQFGFFNGATLEDPEQVLTGKGKYVRHVKVYTRKDINTDILGDLIRQAMK